MNILSIEIILYVADQMFSRNFYASILGIEPSLDVPGMTEFEIGGAKLGLMPTRGIESLLGKSAGGSDPAILKCELYLFVDDPMLYADRARSAGAIELSPLQIRDWGDEVAYFADYDSNVIAFAHKVG